MLSDIIKTWPFILAASFVLDAIIGDPKWLPHPVRLMGRVISYFDAKLNRKEYNNTLRIFLGAVFAMLFTGFVGLISGVLLLICFKINYWLGIAIGVIMSTYCLAGHDLIKHAMNVYNYRYDLNKARSAVGMIVGRETSVLNEQGVIKATIESVSESLCDGVIAPAFYIIFLGPMGGMIYKAVNTMDSMIGYHNERYEHYGKPAAEADDIFNFIPSRLSAICIIIASAMIKNMDHKEAYRIWKRDRLKHASPNSAQAESAMAGALRLRLGGPAVYFGKTVDKPYIGDDNGKIIEWKEIRRACILMYTAALLMVSSVCFFSLLFSTFIYPVSR